MTVFLSLLELAAGVKSDCVPMLTGSWQRWLRMAVSLSLLELAERVMSGCVPKLTGAGSEG